MKHVASALVGAVLVAASSVVVLTAPAQAAYPGYSGQLNMWQHDGYKGQMESRVNYDSNLGNDSCPGCDPGPGGNFNDDMSSFVNKTKYWWIIYVDTGMHATSSAHFNFFCVRPNSHDADLGNNGFSYLEDEISSVKRLSATGSTRPYPCPSSHLLGYRN